ncbi:hypothetical protein MWN34_19005 [Ancylobacter sp. 6x-1]|uniref:Protamine-2 (Modular protein) n=1 Tax=Ancylobacter crimeensis TaxID=2579147 RepID=A0ABT0DGW1_9HYPH|nr:hypothetical protein [Ancylobacter crimeensis]MCK0198992.1 hypothetical protein [Ancylobacter crimeensis]
MDRRGFLFGLLGLAGAGGTLALSGAKAEATVLGQLKNIAPLEPETDVDVVAAGSTPDGTPIETVRSGWHRPPPPRRRRRRVRVCRRVRDRWGRVRNRCWYEWR